MNKIIRRSLCVGIAAILGFSMVTPREIRAFEEIVVTTKSNDMLSAQVKVDVQDASITHGILSDANGKIDEQDTKDNTLTFTVYKNGEYTFTGFDEQDQLVATQKVSIHEFEELMAQEDETHAITIISRAENCAYIQAVLEDEKETLSTTKIDSGYRATLQAKRTGVYTFTAFDIENKAISKPLTLNVKNVAEVSEDGKYVIRTVEDLKQIKNNPGGTFILHNDIEMKENVLSQVDFSGTLDGNGYSLTFDGDILFQSTQQAVIKNIAIFGGMFCKEAINTTIESSAFYMQVEDANKDIALLLKSTGTNIKNSFVLANVEGNQVAGYFLEGEGIIKNSYVSGYLKGNKVYGFAKKADIENSYISASLVGDNRVLFSNGERKDCFYDAQINDLEDLEATPYFTKEMISGKLRNPVFMENAGTYPQIKAYEVFKKQGKALSKLSVEAITSSSNLSALESNMSISEDQEINWEKSKVTGEEELSLQGNEGELSAENNQAKNRFALRAVRASTNATAGVSTTQNKTQVMFPVEMGTYYKVVVASETVSLPKTHEKALEDGWRIMYWKGEYKWNSLDWNQEYKVYATDLQKVEDEATIKTNFGKNGGKLTLSGVYAIGNKMSVELHNTNTTKGTLYWESAETLDASNWTILTSITFEEGDTTASYEVQGSEAAKYLRARFVSDNHTGYEGELSAKTQDPIKLSIDSVTITNKTASTSAFTLEDHLVASIAPSGKDNDASFAWYHEGEDSVLGVGRNYTIKGSDVGKKLYVKATAKNDGELKGEAKSKETSEILSIQCTKPKGSQIELLSKEDITATLTMKSSQGVYRFGYATTPGGTISADVALSRNNTKRIITGLKANTTYYFYVQEVGESGYTDSEWSSDYLIVTTENEFVRGDIKIEGNTIYEETLKAVLSNTTVGQTGDIYWYRLDEDGIRESTPIASKSDTYTLTKADIGKRLEVALKGNGSYTGEISNISDEIVKKEFGQPTDSLTFDSMSDTTITIKTPTNTNGEHYIVGLSASKDGVPIEYQEDGGVKTYASDTSLTIKNLDRDTTYFLFIRYAENDVHQKSDWNTTDLALEQKTDKKIFKGKIEFTYETVDETLMQGQKLIATIHPEDSVFNYKGTWEWFKVENGSEKAINNIVVSSDKKQTSYEVPKNETVGVTYKVKFSANVGYTGSIEANTNAVEQVKKATYEKPDANAISMEAIDDSSIKVKMSEGEGKYRFWYKAADTNAIDSFAGFLGKALGNSSDGYIEIAKDVYSNVDVLIEGLDRNKAYAIRVQRVEDDKGESSDFTYSSEATQKTITTKKTAIAGYVSINGTTRYDEKLTAIYQKAEYASTGGGSDENGNWQWYRGDIEIKGETSDTYQVKKEDIGYIMKAVYTMPKSASFEGSVEGVSTQIDKAISENPQVLNVNDVYNKTSKEFEVTLEIEKDTNGQKVYYRIMKEGEIVDFPNDEEALKAWNLYSAEVKTTKDSDLRSFETRGNYVIYLIKTASETNEASSVVTKSFTIGKKPQLGSIKLSGRTHVGQALTATLNDENNTIGEWHWYYSKTDYNTTSPSEWIEIVDGFSPNQDSVSSTLIVPDEAKGKYISAKFISTNEDYTGTIDSGKSGTSVTKTYTEKLNISGKGYMNEVLTIKVEDSDRDVSSIILQLQNSSGGYLVNINAQKTATNVFKATVPQLSPDRDEMYFSGALATPDRKIYTKEDGTTISTYIYNDTNKRVQFHYGIPITNESEFIQFMKGEGKYKRTGTSSAYQYFVLTNNLNMSSYSTVSVLESNQSYQVFNGDYHTIVGLKNSIFVQAGALTIRNCIFYNSNVNPIYTGSDMNLKSGAVIANTAWDSTIENCFLASSTLNSNWDTGYMVGRGQGGLRIKNSGSVGGTVKTTASGTSLGGFVGYNGSEKNGSENTILNGFSINTSLVAPSNLANAGGFFGGTTNTVKITDSYVASPVPSASSRGTFVGGGPVTSSYGFYDSTIMGTSFSQATGTSRPTSNMIGNSLNLNSSWTYIDGFYPQLNWLKNHPISNLYATTRGAFTSVDNATNPTNMFNGNIYGPIAVPEVLKNDNYTITSNSSNLKVVNKTIIPTGNVGGKGVITIKYTEPDPTIGGSVTNTFEFTIKQKVNAMSKAIVTGKAQFGEKLTIDTDGVGTSYEWYRRKSGSTTRELIKGESDSTYTLTASDIGYEIMAKASASGYATMESNYSAVVISQKPTDGPVEVEKTDSEIIAKVDGIDGMIYEVAYQVEGSNDKVILSKTYQNKDEITVDRLQRNTTYEWFVRIAGGTGYNASEWSDATKIITEKTKLVGNIVMGSNVNNGTDVSFSAPTTNGQTGVWKLERIPLDSETGGSVISEAYATTNICSYTLKNDDVGQRMKATFIGNGNYKGSITIIGNEILTQIKSAPQAPELVSATDNSLTVKVNESGTFDIGYANSTTGQIIIAKDQQAGNSEIEIPNLGRHETYYVYARSSSIKGVQENSAWSVPTILATEKSEVSGDVSLSGTLKTDEEIMFTAAADRGQSGTWKLERITSGSYTTISPSSYLTDDTSRTLTYIITAKDAGSTLKATYLGNGDFKGEIALETKTMVGNTGQAITDGMPTNISINKDTIKDYSFDVKAEDGKDIYQFGYAKENDPSIYAYDATAYAGTYVTINGLSRNTVYDVYVRKAAKRGYEASEWKKYGSQRTAKSDLSGSISYTMLDIDGNEVTAKVGIADMNSTYKAEYIAGTYDQSVDDTNAGEWQWYAGDDKIAGATSNTYTIGKMEGNPEISVRYEAKDTTDFKNYQSAVIGVLTKPAFAPLNQLPQVIAVAEDGEIDSKLKIIGNEIDDVYYYVQEAKIASVPQPTSAYNEKDNEAQVDKWFAAKGENMVTVKPNTAYVVYAARLSDSSHQSSGVISLRSLRSAKDNLSGIHIDISEADTTSWKALQGKELRISAGFSAPTGVWQYYVSKDKDDASSWQNITTEIKNDCTEGQEDKYSFSNVVLPMKYTDGYYVRVVFTGRKDYEGSIEYISKEVLQGTQISGYAEIESLDASEIFVPVKVKYQYAKDANGLEIEDEASGTWTWYRETSKGSGKFEKIERESDTIGRSDSFTPRATEVDRKIYAIYTSSASDAYSGSVQTNIVNDVDRAEQNIPTDIKVRQINGTSIQMVLPENMKVDGKTIAQPVLEYKLPQESEWTKNTAGNSWIKDLKANTKYEIRAKFNGTSEYKPSGYSNIKTVTTGNYSFDEDHLTLTYDKAIIEVGDKIKATFSGSGYDEGYFVVLSSDGREINAKATGTIEGTEVSYTYECTSDDIGSNVIVRYNAYDDAQVYGGYVEKTSKEIAKPERIDTPQTPILQGIRLSETTLKVAVDDACEYVFTTSSATISSTSTAWQKLSKDAEGYYTFTSLDNNRDYYLHVRYGETSNYRASNESITAATKPWHRGQYSINYYGIEGALNGSKDNPNITQFSEMDFDITLQDASKTGYIFEGWSNTPDGNPEKNLKIVCKDQSDDVDIYAHWSVAEYKIEYVLQSGTGNVNAPVKYTIETTDFTLPEPTRSGYNFTGWTWGSETVPQKEVIIPTGTSGDLIFKANWEVARYKITYALDGGTQASTPISEYTILSETIDLVEPSRIGYTFVGWTKADQDSPSKDMKIQKGSTGDVSFKAHWKIIEYDIIYDFDGGSDPSNNLKNYTIESNDITLVDPFNPGYDFLGWTFVGQSTPLKPVTIKKGETGNKQFKANWKAINYSITYELNGGTNSSDNPKNYQVDTPTITLKAPTKPGYAFEGWVSDALLTPEKNAKIMVGTTGELRFEAQWQKADSTITFDTQGGSSIANQDALKGSTIHQPNDPIKKGYYFIGWYTEDTFTHQWDFENDTISDDITLYAKWSILSYDVSFDGNQGSDATGIQCKYNSKIGTLPTSSRAGYTFEGWYDQRSGGNKITEDTLVVEDVVYYAHWKAITYSITYHLYNGVNADHNPKSYTIEDETITLEAPTLKDYVFQGWNEDGSTTKEINYVLAKGSMGDIILHANWVKSDYTVTFDSQQGSSVDAQYVLSGDLLKMPKEPTRKGYSFEGWYYDRAYTKEVDFINDTITKNTTLYAKWEILTLTLTYDAMGGEAVQKANITYGDSLTTLPLTSRKGYTFDGWYTKENGGSKVSETTTIEEDITLYAHWTIIDYSITYDMDYGSNSKDNPSIYNVATNTISIQAPQRPGYIFEGWSKDGNATLEKDVKIQMGSIGNIHLKAVWSAKSYQVHYDVVGSVIKSKENVGYFDFNLFPNQELNREGYTFAGWYDDKGNLVLISTTYAELAKDDSVASITLYAHWVADKVEEPEKPVEPSKPVQPIVPEKPIINVTVENNENKTKTPEVNGEASNAEGEIQHYDGVIENGKVSLPKETKNAEVKGSSTISVGKGHLDINISKGIQTSDLETFINAILSKEQLAKIADGKIVSVELFMEEIPEEKVDILTKIKQLAKDKDITISNYYDVKVRVKENGEWTLMDTLHDTIELMFDVPETLQTIDADFYILHGHDDVVELLEDMDKDKTTVTVDSKKFSTYVMGYQMREKKEGVSNHVYIYIFAFVIIAGGILAFIVIKRKKQEKA